MCLQALGINDVQVNKELLLDEIAMYIFDVTNKGDSKEKVFDFNLDYKYYFPDFLDKGINLNKDNLDWWEFDSILESLFLNPDSNISRVIAHRTYEKPSKNVKTQENKEHQYRMKMKRKYALPDNNQKTIGQNLDKLWRYVEKKVGDAKEQ